MIYILPHCLGVKVFNFQYGAMKFLAFLSFSLTESAELAGNKSFTLKLLLQIF
jgi:hypothetical protein